MAKEALTVEDMQSRKELLPEEEFNKLLKEDTEAAKRYLISLLDGLNTEELKILHEVAQKYTTGQVTE